MATKGRGTESYASVHCSRAKHETGTGGTLNVRQAPKLYRVVAENGHANGQMLFAKILLLGKGVAQDTDAAAQWYLKAAEARHMVAKIQFRRNVQPGIKQEKEAALAMSEHNN